ncbi:MAG TPA: hypothetical protein VEB86_10605 [Chryseosolibacter sp.]|nr:hypothetical protein [Chryseosolibacter sp.]
MDFLRQLVLYISLMCLLFLFVGLYKPWAMLWWEHVQNRRKVIKLYGTIGLICYAIYWALYFVDLND